jgi:tRNA modification GTPase
MDTIFALASARGKAGVAVIRISGPDAHSAVQELCGDRPSPRRASVRKLRDGDGELIDEALVLVFEEGKSFTGEAAAELHLHGSPAVVAAVSRELSDRVGLRAAEAGEFTRRALDNERLDLAQVEGLADLIEAETEAQRKLAVRVFSGALGEKVERWRERLIRAAALLEATIDFADEEVPVDVGPEVSDLLSTVMNELKDEIAGSAASERIREGFEVAIIGAPNVGKSTLLNRLAGREAAITSEVAGTTRDVIEVRMDLGGLPVTFLDTAGLRETEDVVERIGVERARKRAEEADLRILLTEEPADAGAGEADIVVRAKADQRKGSGLAVSGLTGAGVDVLVDMITSRLERMAARPATAMRERHRLALEEGLRALESAQNRLSAGVKAEELVSEEIRAAVRSLESLVGRIGVEDVLDRIFKQFCIGK